MIFLYQKIIVWYQEFDILISINNFYIIFDIKKKIDFEMSENHFLMSQTRISDTKELYFDINKSNYWY